jgi:hypothetical protein
LTILPLIAGIFISIFIIEMQELLVAH